MPPNGAARFCSANRFLVIRASVVQVATCPPARLSIICSTMSALADCTRRRPSSMPISMRLIFTMDATTPTNRWWRISTGCSLGLSKEDRADLVAYLTAVGGGQQPYERDGVIPRLKEIVDFASVLGTAIPAHDTEMIAL